MRCKVEITVPEGVQYTAEQVQDSMKTYASQNCLAQLMWVVRTLNAEQDALYNMGIYLDHRVVGQAERLLAALQERYPGINVVFAGKYEACPVGYPRLRETRAAFRVELENGTVNTEVSPFYADLDPLQFRRQMRAAILESSPDDARPSANSRHTDFYEAYYFLRNHRIFEGDFECALDIYVVKVNPENNHIEDDRALNTHTQVWLETGPTLAQSGEAYYNSRLFKEREFTHDPLLDCGADSFEEAIVKLADLVREYYGE